YAPGDALRLEHWKATARLGRLMVRQFASESQEGYSLWFETTPGRWTRAEQFELACSLAVALAEDLFTSGRLRAVSIDHEPPQPVRHLRDLEAYFDRIARLPNPADTTATPALRSAGSHPPVPASASAPASPSAPASAGPAAAGRRGSSRYLLTFAPDGTRGVAAYVD